LWSSAETLNAAESTLIARIRSFLETAMDLHRAGHLTLRPAGVMDIQQQLPHLAGMDWIPSPEMMLHINRMVDGIIGFRLKLLGMVGIEGVADAIRAADRAVDGLHMRRRGEIVVTFREGRSDAGDIEVSDEMRDMARWLAMAAAESNRTSRRESFPVVEFRGYGNGSILSRSISSSATRKGRKRALALRSVLLGLVRRELERLKQDPDLAEQIFPTHRVMAAFHNSQLASAEAGRRAFARVLAPPPA
jgi:hypothetical protein